VLAAASVSASRWTAPLAADGYYALCKKCAAERQAQRRARLAEQARAEASGGVYDPPATIDRILGKV